MPDHPPLPGLTEPVWAGFREESAQGELGEVIEQEKERAGGKGREGDGKWEGT